MLTPRDILLGVILPAILAGVILLFTWRPWRRAAISRGCWAAPLAIGAGFVVGFLGVVGRPPWPPIDSTEWVVYFAPALVIVAIVDALVKLPWWLRAIVGLAICAVATFLVLRPILKGGEWDPQQAKVLLAGVAIAMFVAWASVDLLAMRASGGTIGLILTLVAMASSAVMMMSGSQKLGQLGGALTAATGAAFVLAWWAGNVKLVRGTALVFVVLWMSLLMSSHFFASLTPLNAGLLYVAILLPWLAEIPMPGNRTVLRWIVRLAAVLIPLGIAAGLAGRSFAKAMSEKAGTYSE